MPHPVPPTKEAVTRTAGARNHLPGRPIPRLAPSDRNSSTARAATRPTTKAKTQFGANHVMARTSGIATTAVTTLFMGLQGTVAAVYDRRRCHNCEVLGGHRPPLQKFGVTGRVGAPVRRSAFRASGMR